METCRQRLERYFRESRVAYQSMSHSTAYTAQEVAAAQHVPGKQVAKVVMVKAGEALVMAVLPAPYRVDLEKLAAAAGAKGARLTREEEFEGIFPDCEVGAMPPFGNLYQVPVYVDASLTE